MRILRLRPNRDSAVSAVNPTGISAVAADSRTRMLNDPLPARRFEWRLDRTRNVGILDLPNSSSKSIEMPLRPMLGRLAVAVERSSRAQGQAQSWRIRPAARFRA